MRVSYTVAPRTAHAVKTGVIVELVTAVGDSFESGAGPYLRVTQTALSSVIAQLLPQSRVFLGLPNNLY